MAYTDRGLVSLALELYGLRHRVEAFGRRNRVGGWFARLKARTKRFHNNFPQSSFKSMET